jgi:hypothetical protein
MPPSNFELLKELNAHAGRICTLVGFLLATISLSLATGPIHDAISSPSTEYKPIYFALEYLGLNMLIVVQGLIHALQPSIPEHFQDDGAYHALVLQKQTIYKRISPLLGSAVILLSAAWVLAYSQYIAFGPWIGGLLLVTGVLGTFRPIWWLVLYVGSGREIALLWLKLMLLRLRVAHLRVVNALLRRRVDKLQRGRRTESVASDPQE